MTQETFVITRKRNHQTLFLLPKRKNSTIWTDDFNKAEIFNEAELRHQKVFEDERIMPANDFVLKNKSPKPSEKTTKQYSCN